MTTDTILSSTSTGATLIMNTSATSAIDFFGDSDWWRVALTAGYGYYINLKGWDSGSGTLFDPWLGIANSAGTVLLVSDDDSGYGLESSIYFAPSSTDTYFLGTEESPYGGYTQTGSYQISLYYDLLASTATVASVTVGSGGTSSIDIYGDADWTAISLAAGETYLFDLKGSATGSGTLVDPWLGIANSSGQLLWSDKNSGVGLDSEIIFTAPSSGTYYLVAYEASNVGVGSYALTTVSMNSVATTLAVGGSVSGNLQSASEIDIFKVTASAGTLLTVTFDAPSGILGSPFEIQLVDSNGPKITDRVTGSDFSFNVGSPSGGTAYITVSPDSSYSAGQYGVTVTSEALDYGTVPTSIIKPLTGDALVDVTTHGYYWVLNAPHVITWAIADSDSSYWLDPNGAMLGIQAIFSNFEAVGDIHFKGLGYYSSVAAANALGADIVVSLDGANTFFSSSSQWARAFFPSTSTGQNPYAGAAGDVWINVNSPANTLSYAPGTEGYFLALHEFGHALGLKHPHDDGGTGHPTYSQAGIGTLNADWATVMSYEDDFDWNLRAWDPATLMPLDLIGLQSIYGANTSNHSGNDTYNLIADNYYQTIWDASGTDLVSAAGASAGWNIYLPDLQLAQSSSVLTGAALLASEDQLASPYTLYWLMGDIENATGSSYDDRIDGNNLANVLNGGAGNDHIDGASGADSLTGGSGNDVFIFYGNADSTLAAMDTIADLQAGDKIEFTGMAGISLYNGGYTYATSVAATVSAIQGNVGAANKAVFFTDSTNGYLYIKGAGTGTSFDGSLIKITGQTVTPALAQLPDVIATLNTAPTFDIAGDGKVTTDFGGSGAGSVTVQADGRIVVSGGSALARYNTDGSLDSSFDVDGKINVGFSQTSSIIVQADGRLIVAGGVGGFALERYNTDGSLDTSFDVDGRASTIGFDINQGYSAALQADGKIVVAGEGMGWNFTLARYNTTGSLDTSFDGDGQVTTDFGTAQDRGRSVTVQADGKILVAGYSAGFVALARYNADGSLDTTFDTDGKVTTLIGNVHSAAYSITVQADGKILVSGSSDNGSNQDFALARYNTNGSLDTSFDVDGKVTTDFGGSGGDYAYSVTLQVDGKIVAAGWTDPTGNTAKFALARYNTDGSLDTSFDADGKVTAALGVSDVGRSVTVQTDGRILVAGSSWDGSKSIFEIIRYNTDGSLDTTFDSRTLNGAPNFIENGSVVVLDSDVQILDAELAAAGNYAGATLTLARNGGANAQDVFSANAGGTLGTLAQGFSFAVDSTTIGTVTTNSGGTLQLTFNSSATQTLVNSAMQQIAYSNSSDAPTASAQINWAFSDGNAGAQGTGGALAVTGSTTVTITSVNDAPTLAVPLAPTFIDTPADDAFTNAMGTLSGSDVDSGTLTYGITGGTVAAGVSTKTGTYGTLSVTTATRAWSFAPNDAAIEALTNNSSENFTVTVSDGSISASQILTINLTGVNDAPVITRPASDLTIVEDGPSVQPFAGLSITDIDDANLQSVTFLIEGWQPVGDFLSVADAPGMSLNIDAIDGTLSASFTGPTTIANFVTTLQGISIGTSTDALAGDRIVHLTVSDGDADTAFPAFTVITEGTNDPATAMNTSATSLTLQSGGVLVPYAGITLVDPDGTASIAGATITLVAASAGDFVAVNVGSTGIVSNFAGGTLTLSGTASLAAYQVVLGTLAFQGSNPGARTLELRIDDGNGPGVASTLGVSIESLPPNTAPVGLRVVDDDQSNPLNGGGGNDILLGRAGNDTLLSGDGDDVLDGGRGADQMAGGNGNDLYVVDHRLDQITELAASGIDSVSAKLSHALADNVENLFLTGSVTVRSGGGFFSRKTITFDLNSDGTGNESDNLLRGNRGHNALDGQGGNDTLLGGAGADILNGSTGADRLLGGAGADSFVFAAGDGGTTLAGADMLYDFEDGVDRIALAGGLDFADLNIFQGNGTDTSTHNTVIGMGSEEYLVIILGTNASAITVGDFQLLVT